MEQIGDMKVYTLDEVTDEVIGPIGTPRRDKLEAEVAESLRIYHEKTESKKQNTNQ